MVRAIILAAGASSRMGRPKAALPIPGRADTFVSRVIHTCLAAGLPDIVVVSGAHDVAVRVAVGPCRRPIRVVHNAEWQRGQLSSLLMGMDEPPRHVLEAVLITLVDVPFASVDTYVRVLNAWRSTRAPIVRPAKGDRHGHPVVFDRAVFDDLARADATRGAKAVVRAHAATIVNVPIDDPGAYHDVDTPDEYEALVARHDTERHE